MCDGSRTIRKLITSHAQQRGSGDVVEIHICGERVGAVTIRPLIDAFHQWQFCLPHVDTLPDAPQAIVIHDDGGYVVLSLGRRPKW